MLSLGLGYKLSKYLVADLAYYNSFYFKRRINNDIAENAALLNSSVDGHYKTYSQGLTVSMTLKWDDIFPRVTRAGDEESIGSSMSMNPAAR
ncbi:MAG: hypothetical protein BWY49_00011 [Candidatus Omnitrophica bacterium ADurb.Bin314]|nr:MAG: hypothetical protein BWY49_00011 [Candidatus Omnitrophica bacterium ADurb.Bin314]